MSETTDPAAVFLSSLTEKTSLVKESMNEVFEAFCADHGQARLPALSTFITRVETLRDHLPTGHVPHWVQDALTQARRAAERLRSNHDPRSEMAHILRGLAPQILNQEWSFMTKSPAGFDFDSVYERFRTEYGLAPLFDHLIAAVEALLKDPDLDSRKAATQLERLRESLRKSKGGKNYFQAVFSLRFAKSFIVNSALEFAGDSAIGVLVKGFRKALEEAEAGVEQVTESVQAEAQKELGVSFVALQSGTGQRLRLTDESAGSE
ncbi:MAG: hypothetical protein U0996_08490 [Planctomycetaceae bacterium]